MVRINRRAVMYLCLALTYGVATYGAGIWIVTDVVAVGFVAPVGMVYLFAAYVAMVTCYVSAVCLFLLTEVARNLSIATDAAGKE